MSKKKSIITHIAISALVYLLINIVDVFAVRVDIPGDEAIGGYEDINIPNGSASGIVGNQHDIINLIKMINNYLWLTLGAVCLAVTIYGGFLLITAQGDKAKLQKSNQILLGSGIGIIVCVMAYVIVRVVVNLF